jgi:hypothetical protein
MNVVSQIVAGLLFLLYVVFMVSSWFDKSSADDTAGQEEITIDNPAQIGVLVGLMGGTMADAAIVQSALLRFEQTHGRKPTMQDAGSVVGLLNSMKAESLRSTQQ